MPLWFKIKICTALVKAIMWIDPHFMTELFKQGVLHMRIDQLERSIGNL